MASSIRVATDVGGTFTDLVFFRDDPVTGEQHVFTSKADTTPPDFERGVLDVLAKASVDGKDISMMAHGTTVVINALTERKGVKTGLLTTKGFRDSLEIARGNRPDYFNLFYRKPEPFVPRYLRREVPGRIGHDGGEREPLDLSGVSTVLEAFKDDGVQAVAICLLHAYANPVHEKAVMAEVRRLWPAVSVVASHQITREWREYERTSTTVLSAYVQPIAERYLSRLISGLREGGFDGQLYVMQSNCGVDSVDRASQIPITMVESGPASGFWGAAELGRLIGEPNLLALDIGGTTAKCSLILDGQVKVITDYWIERTQHSAGYPIMVPVVDLVEIGNGGGSIAWVDDFGKLHVGPKSAGAKPGPAAYGRGGTIATSTDANLALRRINPEYFCGGEIKADMTAVTRSLQDIADQLGVSSIEVARGIVRIANNNMVNALKLVSVNRGHDPRDLTLVAFGGGGAMHAVGLAGELGMRKVVIPRTADVFSAWGMMMSDLRRDYFVTRIIPLQDENLASLNALLEEVEHQASNQYIGEGIGSDRIRLQRYGKLRYENQEHTVEVPLPDGRLDLVALGEVIARFHADYEREYTYQLDLTVEFVGLHLIAFAEISKLVPKKLRPSGHTVTDARKSRRDVDYAEEGIHAADIYDGSLLQPGMEFAGPAVIETKGTTIVVHPGNQVSVDEYGNFHILLGGISS